MKTTIIGIPLRRTTQAEANAVRAALNEIAARHGYLAWSGPTTGRGSFGALMLGIASGEVATVLLGDEERRWLIDWLERQHVDDPFYAAAPRALAQQLRMAAWREEGQDEHTPR